MTRFALLALTFLFAAPAVAQDPAPGKMRGATRTPAHKLLAIPRFAAPPTAAPAQFAVVPKQLSVWGNDRYGDCVSAQEAFALAAWSTRCLGADREVYVPEADLVAWARKYGLLNGADLTQVMDLMAQHGIAVGGTTYRDGPYSTVNYSKPDELRAALYVGPVNIAIDANALPPGAGSQRGWYATAGGRFPNTDHCVALTGYGSATFLYQSLYNAGHTISPNLPAGLTGDTPGYLLFTWNTIGFVTQAWIDGTTTEAYVRNPTTVGMTPTPDPPTPPNPPTPPAPPTPPVPPVPGANFTGTLSYVNGVLVAVTPGGMPPAPPTPPAPTAADLAAAGLSPDVFADALQLLTDLRTKPIDRAKVRADFRKLFADFIAPPAAGPMGKAAPAPVGVAKPAPVRYVRSITPALPAGGFWYIVGSGR